MQPQVDWNGYKVTNDDIQRSKIVDGMHVPQVSVYEIPYQNQDAFSRMRVSAPGYRFDSQFTYRIDSDLWDTTATGSGSVSHDATNRMAICTTTAGAGAHSATLQSHYAAPYTPGRGQLAFITFNIPNAIPDNGEVGVGYYNGTDGVYLKKTSSGVTLNLDNSTSLANESVAQADWNYDTFDGNGPSGITLDLTKTAILVIQLQALYVGAVHVGFDVNGQFFLAHIFEHANVSAYPYIAIASQPIRFWAIKTDSGSASVINAICCTVISEGGESIVDIPGREFAAKGALSNATDGTILVIRNKAQLNSINSSVVAIPLAVNASVADAPCWIEIRENATITAGTFEDVNAASAVEVSYAGNAGTDPTVTAGTGTLLDTFYVPASASTRASEVSGLVGKAVMAYSHLLSTADSISVMFSGGGATTDVFASIKWKEIR